MFSLKKLFKKDTISEQEVVSQDSEYEILEITELSFIQTAKIWLQNFFRVKKHVIITAVSGGAVVVAVAGIVITVSVVSRIWKQKSTDVAAAIEDTSTQMETAEEMKAPVLSLYLEAVADENTITASVYGEDGEILSGHNLVFNLLSGSKEDNEEKIEKLKSAYAGQNVEDVDKEVYEDDDKDGTVLMPDLETGTYTLVVQAEEGYKTPDAAEATVETFAVMDDIMEKVVADSAATQKEDPSKNRSNSSPAVSVPETTASAGQVNVTALKKSGDNIIYKITGRSTMQLTDDEAARYTAGSVLIDDQSVSAYSGYIYETGKIQITGGQADVVTKFLVPERNISAENVEMINNTTVFADNLKETAAGTKETQSETKTTGESTKSEETTKGENTKPSDNQSMAARKNYVLLSLEAETETVYADGWQNIQGKTYYFRNSQAVTGWNQIDGLQYYFNGDGSLGSHLVIDVSTYNGDIDWNRVKEAGIDYAIIRVGYRGYETARLVKDKRFDTNMSNATAAGVKVGAYIVTQAVNTNEAVEEASFIISACSGYNVSLPLAIDIESAGNGSGRGDKISVAERTAVINAFVQTIRGAGYSAMVYANKDWMTNRINAGGLASGSTVWLAQYRSSCTYGGSYQMWQFTESGSIPGISGNVDMSAWKY
jgi:GH25 family lysozyme M1 (1,4-beta-N-acetylmuramidase)